LSRQSRSVVLLCLLLTRRDTRGKRGYDGIVGSLLAELVCRAADDLITEGA